MIDGEVFVDQMVEESIARPDLLAFCERVNVIRDEEREKKGRAFARGADIEVFLKNGQMLSKTVDNFLGSYQRPMTDEQMATKFRRLASKALAPENVAVLERVVRNLEAAPTVVELVEVLRGEQPSARSRDDSVKASATPTLGA